MGPSLFHTGYVHPARQPWLGLSREAPLPEGRAGQHSVHRQASPVSAFTGCAGQPACSSCFILSAAENQTTWNTVLMVSHRGPGPAKLHPALSPHPPSGVKCPPHKTSKRDIPQEICFYSPRHHPTGPGLSVTESPSSHGGKGAGCCRGLQGEGTSVCTAAGSH